MKNVSSVLRVICIMFTTKDYGSVTKVDEYCLASPRRQRRRYEWCPGNLRGSIQRPAPGMDPPSGVGLDDDDTNLMGTLDVEDNNDEGFKQRRSPSGALLKDRRRPNLKISKLNPRCRTSGSRGVRLIPTTIH